VPFDRRFTRVRPAFDPFDPFGVFDLTSDLP
jgi:hypothetical protein